MANRFLNNIRINDEYTLPSADGSANQIIITDGAGNLSFVDTTTIAVGESEQVHIACKNTSGVAISKGDPVYITGTVGTSYIVQIAKADASNSAKMPAVGLAETDLAINAEGYVIVSGVLKNLTTDPLSTGDGTPSSNDTVYVKAGGGLTKTKPTGSGNLIQNVGKVGRVSSANAGSLAVSTIMRTNDVPNLTIGKIWVGSSTYTTESTVVHLDEGNGRMGIGTTSPAQKLEVSGNILLQNNNEIRFKDSGGTERTAIELDSSNDLNIGTSAGGNLKFINGSSYTERMRITSGGNVGIGTTSPGSTLDVSSSGANGIVISRDTGTTSNSGRLFFETDTASEGVALMNGNGVLQFRTGSDPGATSGTIKMVLTSGGNVGIGTTSPTAPLDTNGVRIGRDFSIANRGTVRIDSNGTAYPSDVLFGHTAAANQSSWSGVYWSLSSRGTSDSGKFQLWRGSGHASPYNSELRIITVMPSGDTGIGETDPTQKLHVAGNIRVTGAYYDSGNSAGTSGQVLSSTATGTSWVSGSGLPGGPYLPLSAGASYFLTGDLYVDNTIRDINAEILIRRTSNILRLGSGDALDSVNIYSGGQIALTLDTSQNVGIGTTSPVNKQQNKYTSVAINSMTATAGTASTNWNRNAGLLIEESNSSNGLALGVSQTANDRKAWIQSGHPNSAANSLGIISLNPLGGNVGIGTISPGHNLNVSSPNNTTAVGIDIGTNASFDFAANSTSGYTTLFYMDDTGLDIGHNSSGRSINFKTGGTDKLTILGGGNVGIGTTSPSSPLTFGKSVYGNFDSENFYRIKLQDQGGTYNDVGIGQTASGNMGFNITAGGEFIFNNGTSGEIARFNGTGLGIGTTSPLGRLQVNEYTVGAQGNQTVHGELSVFANSGDESLFLGIKDATYPNRGWAFNPVTNGVNSDLQIKEHGSSGVRMTIKTGGNIGIGTTSPSAPLHIYQPSASGLKFSRLNHDDIDLSLEGSNRFVISNTTDGLDIMSMLYDTGNVGIGTTSPSQDLTLYRDSGDTNFLISSNNGASQIFFGDTESDNIGKIDYDHSNDSLNFVVNASERMRITSGGQLIVGGTTVGYGGTKLQVGNTSDSQNGLNILTSTTGYGYILFGDGAAAATYVGQITYKHGDDYMSFQTNGSEKVRILANGNVGIKNTSPHAELVVGGYIDTSDVTNGAFRIYNGSTFRGGWGTADWAGGNFGNLATDLVAFVAGANNYMIGTNSQPRLTVSGAGSLKLNNYGSGTFTGTATQRLAVDSSGNVIEIPIGSGPVDGTGTANYVTKWSDADTITNSVIYDDGTNVGIGTTSPATKLNVAGNIAVTSGSYISFLDSNLTYNTIKRSTSVGGIQIDTGGSASMNILDNGNVGIGTTSPSSIGTGITTLDIQGSNAGGVAFGVSGTKNYIYGASTMYVQANTTAAFLTSGTEKMRITSGGNVGIGQTNPGAKLHVDGDIISTDKIKINGGHNSTRLQLYYDYGAGDTNDAQLLLWASEPGITYSGVGIGANIDTEGHYYGRYSALGDYGVIMRMRPDNGNIEFATTTSAVNTSGATWSTSLKITPSGGLTMQGNNVWHAGNDGAGSGLDADLLDGNHASAFALSSHTHDDRYYTETESDNRFVNVTGDTMTGNLSLGSNNLTAGKLIVQNQINTNSANLEINYQNGDGTTTNYKDFYVRDGKNNVIMVVDGSAGSVGIGITNPSAKLHVYGGRLEVDSIGNIPIIRARYNANYYTDFNSNGITFTGTGQNFNISDNGSSSLYIKSGGNVGIGTTSPAAKLTVDGESSSRGIELKRTGTLTGNAYLRLVGVDTQEALSFNVNDSEKVRITYAGNVGIGTTSPAAKLDVTGGDIRLSTNATYLRSKDSASATPRVLGMNASSAFYIGPIDSYAGGGIIYGASSNVSYHGFYGGGSEKVRITSSGNVGIGTTSPQQKLQVASPTDTSVVLGASYLSTNNNNFFEVGISANDGYLNLRNSGVVTTVHIDSDNSSYFNGGNVGIGTTNPEGKLHVKINDSGATPISQQHLILENNSATGLGILTPSSTSGYIFFGDENDAQRGYISYSHSTDNMTFKVNGVERMRITSNGNVGIGATNPLVPLHLENAADILAIFSSTDNKAVITIKDDDTTGYISAENARMSFGANTGANANNFNIDLSTNNVGIGTTNPGTKLEVEGTTTTDNIVYDRPSATGQYRGELVYFGSFLQTTAAGDLICLGTDAGSPVWRLANNGNSVDSTGMLGIALGSNPSDGILVRGYARATGYSVFADGGKVYISGTDGDMTTTAPGSGTYLRIVGYVIDSVALSHGEIYFCPDNTWVEIA